MTTAHNNNNTCACCCPAKFLDEYGSRIDNILIKLKEGIKYSVIGFPGCNLDDEDDDGLTDALVTYCEKFRSEKPEVFMNKSWTQNKEGGWCLTLMSVAKNTYLVKFRPSGGGGEITDPIAMD